MALVFKVRRSEPELVQPAKPTPNDVKSLSDWDDVVVLRDWLSCISFYNYSPTTSKVLDPTEVIKKALAEALVYYYPWAGRLKEQGPDKRLVVDCTAEGVVFVSADADVRLDQFGLIRPPFPELLYNRPSDSTATLNCPIFVMQVTRLACGGFILAFSFNHVMSDMVGVLQFVNAISELACGAHSPSVLPVWQRELLNARDKPPPSVPNKSIAVPPPSGGFTGDPPLPPPTQSDTNKMTCRSFFFGDKELEAIRARIQQRPGDRFTSFELISGCMFHCRVVSLEHAPEEQVRAVFTVNARSKFVDPPLPSGYYGNASFPATIVRPMQSFHDLRYVVEEVRKAKEAVTEDYARRSIEEEAIARCSGSLKISLITCPTYGISDVSRAGLSCLDFGWGKPVYAGVTEGGMIAQFFSFMVALKDNIGKEGRLITHYMPKDAIDKFDITLQTLLGSI